MEIYETTDSPLRNQIEEFYIQEFALVSEYIINYIGNRENTISLKPLKYFEQDNEFHEMLLKQFDFSDQTKEELNDFKNLVKKVNTCIENNSCGVEAILKNFFEGQTDKTRIILIHQDNELLELYEDYIS